MFASLSQKHALRCILFGGRCEAEVFVPIKHLEIEKKWGFLPEYRQKEGRVNGCLNIALLHKS